MKQLRSQNFIWNLQSALITIWLISSVVLLINEAWQSGDYTSVYLWLIALCVGYCVYMLSLVVGEVISYRLIRLSGDELSTNEKAMMCANLLNSVPEHSCLESYKILEDKDKSSRGVVIVLPTKEIDVASLQDTKQQEIVYKIKELLQALNDKKP